MIKKVAITVPERQMLIEQTLNSESIQYNINFAFEISGNIELEKLVNSL
ncbi:hypothetical protein ALNOE001_07150 [Candidatus Methanobinarius endosymbioticus]|uniref:Uncharacterized protein n=1 Tax=Candidatus Methanobinarius endosymbioticus TaxID=2006182 RepID=A0A366MD84_9EURY|nr:hypothetical protein ALNOE001_07150 [Candidatus Methanobinarius endosymbioticus]